MTSRAEDNNGLAESEAWPRIRRGERADSSSTSGGCRQVRRSRPRRWHGCREVGPGLAQGVVVIFSLGESKIPSSGKIGVQVPPSMPPSP